MDFLFAPSTTTRFLTTFLFGGIPSPLDIAFQSITGLTRELNVTAYSEGGENSRNNYLADKIQHGTLVLERGIMPVTPLALMFDRVMQGEDMVYADVVIMVMNSLGIPVCGWAISNALPIRWQTGDLDANATGIAVNTLELKYQDIRWMGVVA